MLSEGSHILRDPGAACRDHTMFAVNRMFVVKVYYKVEKNPWALTLTKSVPETFKIPASDWPQKKCLANQRRGAAG